MIKKIAVIGAGQMGTGIAQVFLNGGFEVILNDTSLNALNKAKERIKGLAYFSENILDIKNADLVIEAIIENEEAKKDLFYKLDNLVNEKAIFASNTSSISITKLSSAVKRKERFMGVHFMNPVPKMALVELILGAKTSKETLSIVEEILAKIGKTTTLSKDFPGFIANRILMPMINEAFYTLMEGVSNKEDIDKTLKLGCNFPMGPLTLADFIGLDVCLSILNVLYEGFGQSKYAPCPLLKNYVNAGLLGRKSGEGVYKYGL